MDTPKQDVSCLIKFPPDIWAYLVSYLSGEQIGRLKMTGSALLWRKLTFSGVVKAIKLGNDFLQFKSWPAYLNEFLSLEELSIHSPTEVWWSEMGVKLNLIPSTVRKLRFTGPYGLFFDFSNFFVGPKGEDLHFDELLPHLEILDIRTMRLMGCSWMTRCPPTLTKLSTAQWDGQSELPSSLLHLTLSRSDAISLRPGLKFPPHLETLDLCASVPIINALVPLLPASFLRLTCEISQSSLHKVDIGKLPRAMISFHLNSFANLDLFNPPESVSLLPPTLTELDIPALLPTSAWATLPANLKTLCCRTDQSCTVTSKNVRELDDPFMDETKKGTTLAYHNYALQTYPFNTLPRTLTDLHCVSPGTPGVDNLFFGPPSEDMLTSYFPLGLTSLSLACAQLAVEVAKLLPTSLTRLKIGALCERVCEFLPSGLRELTGHCTLMSPNLIKFLPESLTFLALTRAIATSRWYHDATGCNYQISKFPEYAKHVKCESSMDWKGDFSLPPGLTHLKLRNFEMLQDAFIMNQQISKLLELRLESGSNQISDLSIPFLSPRLKILILSQSIDITGKSFAALPRCLVWLDLNSASSIFDCDVQHLPRTLKKAYLDSAIHLTDTCVRQLPQNLELISLKKNAKITPSSFPYFPYTLRYSQVYRSVQLAKWSIRRGAIDIYE